MKTKIYLTKTLLLMLNIFYSSILFAQSIPQGINYQAVARDANGNELVNQVLDVKLAIKSKSGSTYTSQWEEIHQITTNEYGLFTLVIGKGTSTGNGTQTSFSNVPWSSYDMYLNVSVDDGNGYVDLGKTQLVSVPYALVAGSSISGSQGATGPTGPSGADGSANAWGFTGNAGTSVSTNFIGTTDAVSLAFKTNNTENMRILSSGNIGVGTTSADAKMVVSADAGTDAFRVRVGGNTKLMVGSNNGVTIGVKSSNAPYNGLYVNGRSTFGADTTNSLYNSSNSKVLINTDDDDLGLYVYNSYSAGTSIIGTYSKAESSGALNGAITYGIKGYGNSPNGSNYGVYGVADNSSADNNIGVMGYAEGGTTNYGVKGKTVNMGSSGVYGESTASYSYGVYGKADVNLSGAFAIYADGDTYSSNGVYQSSDIKLKKNINSLENALEKVMLLSPKTYEFKNDEYAALHLPKGIQIGLIVQDVEKIFPEMVKENIFPGEIDEQGRTISEKVEFKCMNYTALIPLLTKAIQEQQELIKLQNELNKTQQQQIDELTQKLNQLSK